MGVFFLLCQEKKIFFFFIKKKTKQTSFFLCAFFFFFNNPNCFEKDNEYGNWACMFVWKHLCAWFTIVSNVFVGRKRRRPRRCAIFLNCHSSSKTKPKTKSCAVTFLFSVLQRMQRSLPWRDLSGMQTQPKNQSTTQANRVQIM